MIIITIMASSVRIHKELAKLAAETIVHRWGEPKAEECWGWEIEQLVGCAYKRVEEWVGHPPPIIFFMVRFGPRSRAWCNKENGVISLSPKNGLNILEDLGHEFLHCFEPDWDEARIEKAAVALFPRREP